MSKCLSTIFLAALLISGLFAADMALLGSAQNSQSSSDAGEAIRRVQSLSNGTMLTQTYGMDNATGQSWGEYAENQTSAVLNSLPVEGDVLVAAVGIDAQVDNVPTKNYGVSSISQKDVTWTRVVNQSYLGWHEEVSIWLGVVHSNADSKVTFNLFTDPPTPSAFILTYALCEYSGVSTTSPVDMTASNFDIRFLSSSDTGQTALTSAPNELWIGAILTYSSVAQSGPKNDFLMVGGSPTYTGGRMSTTLLEKIVNQTGNAETGTNTNLNGEEIYVTSLGCIATFFAEDQSSTGALNPTPPPSSQNGVFLQFNCQGDVSSHGIRVNIEGSLKADGIGVANASILFSYSVNNGASWMDLTSVNTDGMGGFAVLWMPSVTGNYMVKAEWAGNDTYPVVNTTVSFALSPLTEDAVFSVNSNSTLSALSFNSTTSQLSFSVSGVTGTTGYVEVYIPKTLLSNIPALTVDLDGTTLPFTYQSMDNAWLISFTYHHSTRQVTMNMNVALSNPPSGNKLIEGAIIGAAIAATAIAIVFFIVRKTKR
jgi:hypothetical protein